MAAQKGTYYQNKRSGKNKFGYAVNRGGVSFTATGATKRQAYGRMRRGIGANGG